MTLDARAQDTLMLVAPSDHVIPNPALFRDAITAAAPAAKDGQLVTFGIRPNRPETGYGWLELIQAPDATFSPIPQPLRSFVEKPNLSVAEQLLDGGMHLWNAGIFLFSTATIIEAFAKHAPKTLETTRAAFDTAEQDLAFTRLDPEAWERLPDISIDYLFRIVAINPSRPKYPISAERVTYGRGFKMPVENVVMYLQNRDH